MNYRSSVVQKEKGFFQDGGGAVGVQSPSTWLIGMRYYPDESLSGRRTAANSFVGAAEVAIGEHPQSIPIGPVEVGGVFGIDAPGIGAGGTQH